MQQSINNLIDLYQSNENNHINYQIEFKNMYFCNDVTKLCDFLKHIDYATSISFNKTDINNENFKQICEILENNKTITKIKLKNNIWLNNISPINKIIKNNVLETINFNLASPKWDFNQVVDYNNIDDIFKLLSENTSLKTIIIKTVEKDFSIIIPNFNSIEKNNNIEKLNISGFKIQNDITKSLIENKSIKTLKLQNSNLQVDKLQSLLQKNTLYTLHIQNSFISNIQNLLLNNTSISDLDLSYCNLSNINDIINFIQNNNYLNKLNLSFNSYHNIDALCNVLKNNNSIYKINLSNNNIDDINNFSSVFETNECLMKLNLSHNNISNVLSFSDKLKNNSTLTKLDLSYNHINYVQPLFDCLKNNSALTKLNLKNNQINTINNINDIFTSNKSLLKLNLLNNNYSFTPLIETLYNNDTLTSLYISYNENNDPADTPQKISKLLELNTSLTKLNIKFNTNNIENFLKFSEGLKINKTLDKLYLYNDTYINYHNNMIMKECNNISIKQLIDALMLNTSINTLKIENCLFMNSEINLSCLSNLIKNNTTLTSLNIPSIDKYNYDAFTEALKSNTTLTKL